MCAAKRCAGERVEWGFEGGDSGDQRDAEAGDLPGFHAATVAGVLPEGDVPRA